jgi:carboxymethylenebutenolidase
VYPDAPHSFFDRIAGEHEAACADAWMRMLSFIDRHARV